ncbi:MAG: hypothetical protein KGQ60_00670, partial [Planctomycetes bacterium]|nr:hypothetical protein [Planctomycetota bacterium]
KLLPGIPKQESLAKTTKKGGHGGSKSPVQQASYSEALDVESDPATDQAKRQGKKDREVQTIDLPPSFQRHIQPVVPAMLELDSNKNMAPSESSTTTEVIDLRSRSPLSSQNRISPRQGSFGRDIHEGRSMQSIHRGNDWRSRRPVAGIKQELATESEAVTQNNR